MDWFIHNSQYLYLKQTATLDTDTNLSNLTECIQFHQQFHKYIKNFVCVLSISCLWKLFPCHTTTVFLLKLNLTINILHVTLLFGTLYRKQHTLWFLTHHELLTQWPHLSVHSCSGFGRQQSADWRIGTSVT